MSYVRLLRTSGAAGFFATTALGRLGIAMYGLSLILTAAAVYGDYVRAGIVGGAFAAAEAVGGPVTGRLADRLGQHRTLPAVAAVHLTAAALLALALLAAAPAGVAAACAAAAGASVPQLGALAAARWSHLLRGDPRFETAMALESVANDVAFIAGPLAVSGAVSLAGAPASAALACALAVAASVALARQRRTMPPAQPRPAQDRPAQDRPAQDRPVQDRPVQDRPARRARWRAGSGLGGVGLANLVLGLLFGTAQLAVAALARERGAAGLAGLYYLTLSLGSLLAAAAYGLLRRRRPAWWRFLGAGLLVAAGGAGLVAFGQTGGGFAALFVVGLGVGPIIVVTGTLVERRAAPGRLTEAFALMSALSAGGIALAGPLGGAAVQAGGAAGGFGLIVACGLALAALAVGVRRGVSG
ncbi:MFS transporter [Dactylosporangium sp. CA-139066]|uniref:MFS transporter n=1 Tax=Dactylosporangium sp. CA-139066 TaxID=3239930 RepID=UPI003D8A739D